ncbi:hypothetical protein [Actinomadura sp. DC4]|uniref:baeRF2 domain-containing protein n=1 Tax=Actinomadura sp. DC4 TaxID=3055069 RepID=UPI0025B1E1E3|nr:hypothetical protein [Actinomadura sp. DC4]MDN3352175.1 hypothetical protein [Actinomadura sp. DC4]
MDLLFLRALYDHPGPFASVYLDMRRTEASRTVEARWHARRRELAGQGAPPETVEAIERVVRDEREPGCLAVFATGDEVVYAKVLDGPPRAESARYAPLPHVGPLLEQRGEPVSRLVAVVNRLGARLTCVAADGTWWNIDVPPKVEFPVRKPKGGDMQSQPHAQNAAEDTWRANAKQVALVIERAAGACAGEVIVLAGDVRARAAVLEHLSEPMLTRIAESPSSCGPGLDAEVAAAVERRRTARLRAAVDRYEEQLTKGRRAAGGLAAVVGALRNAQVASLLISPDVFADTPVWTGPRGTDLATSPGELRDLGVAEPTEDRADAAMIRAAACTDGELLLVNLDDWHADQGLGALLRYETAAR